MSGMEGLCRRRVDLNAMTSTGSLPTPYLWLITILIDEYRHCQAQLFTTTCTAVLLNSIS